MLIRDGDVLEWCCKIYVKGNWVEVISGWSMNNIEKVLKCIVGVAFLVVQRACFHGVLYSCESKLDVYMSPNDFDE